MKPNSNFVTIGMFLAAGLSGFGQPVVTKQPDDLLAIPGQQVFLSVLASTTAPPLRYQWQREDEVLPAKTNSSLIITSVQVPDAGGYAVVVSDAAGAVTSRVATLTVIGPVPLDPKLGANLRLGDDPPELPTDRRAQAEPHIIRSFLDPSLLVATFQEGRYPGGGAAAGGYSLSTNAGVGWSRALIPGLTIIDGGPYARASDSVAGVDLEGNIYLCHLVIPISSPLPRGFVISRSTDRGETLDPPMLVFSDLAHEVDKS